VPPPNPRREWQWGDVLPTISKSVLLLLMLAIRVLKDVGITALLLWGLSAVQTLRNRFSVQGWAGGWLIELHEWATVVSYGIFAILLVWDIIELHKGPSQ
jgi:hypothetical protein